MTRPSKLGPEFQRDEICLALLGEDGSAVQLCERMAPGECNSADVLAVERQLAALKSIGYVRKAERGEVYALTFKGTGGGDERF